ncbi:hypothetical protein [Salmonella enterica]|uniref:hypothetical protein n=1 Tax=Salmonella enterica TaxID=28901 RepID=UPI003CC7E382
MEMVRGLVDTLEKHHNVLILDEAVRAAVQLSHRYIPARQLPDKAISLLDTAAARAHQSVNFIDKQNNRLRRAPGLFQ